MANFIGKGDTLMATRFNPLFDKRLNKVVATIATPVVASTLSPITGEPMEAAFCGDIPVLVDLKSRVVLPVKSETKE